MQGTIEQARDVDWIAVDLVAGTRYQIDLEGIATDRGTLVQPALEHLYEEDGTLHLLNAHDVGVGTNDRGWFTPTESGTYYISVQSLFGQIGLPGSEGTYTLSVDVAPEPRSATVDEEDDLPATTDTTDTTGSVAVGDTAKGTIDESSLSAELRSDAESDYDPAEHFGLPEHFAGMFTFYYEEEAQYTM